MINNQSWYIGIWLAYTVLIVVAVIWLFLWAIAYNRSPEQDRARYLPLWSEIPENPDSEKKNSDK